jgi:O-antigen ligase
MPRTADATTLLAFFVVLQLVLPSRLVMNGLPLSLSAAALLALGLGALWLFAQMTTTLGAAKGNNPVRTMLFLYACVLLASYARSAMGHLDPDERAIGDHAMVSTFAMIAVGLAACDGVRSRDRVYFLLRIIVTCSAAVAFVGVLQFLFHYDPTPHLRPPGMHFSSFDTSVGGRDGLSRAAGTAANPIEFGVFCAMALPLALHLAFHATRSKRPVRAWWACVGLIASGLMFSVSRSAIVGVTAAALVLFLGWSPRRRRWMIMAGLGFLVVIIFASPGLLRTFLSLFQHASSDDSVQWRTHDYATAHQLIAQHPWLGRGLGTWYAPKHEVFDNQYLLTLVDSGILGLAALLAVFAAAVYATLRARSLAGNPGPVPNDRDVDRDLALSLVASLVVIFPAFGTFDFAAFPTVTSLSFLLAGLAGALLRAAKRENAEEPEDPYALV